MLKNGLHLVKPDSISNSGGSASITANGSVSFSGVTSLSLNDVFLTLYDNYLIVANHTASTGTAAVQMRLRVANADNNLASSYSIQTRNATSTSVSSTRVNYDYGFLGTSTTSPNANIVSIYGPGISQETAWRTINVRGTGNSVDFSDYVCTHSVSTAYDGFTFYLATGTLTGRVAVYGMVK